MRTTRSAANHDESTAAGDHDAVAKKRARQPDGERKIWLRECPHCGEELHVRRTRCTACGTAQISKRAMTTAKVAADEESTRAETEAAAKGLAAISEASTRVTRAAAATPAPRQIELSAELRLKLVRLRKLHYLLTHPPAERRAPPAQAGVAMAMLADAASRDKADAALDECETVASSCEAMA